MHIRYSRWRADGRDSLDPDSVFDQLNENMNDTGDLQQAMRRLMQKGIKNGEKQTKGIEDLLSQVAREMRKLYDEYRLQSAMEQIGQAEFRCDVMDDLHVARRFEPEEMPVRRAAGGCRLHPQDRRQGRRPGEGNRQQGRQERREEDGRFCGRPLR